VPELVDAAGGEAVGATAGSHSARQEWTELSGLRPDLFVIMLCGCGVERTIAQLAALEAPQARGMLQRVPTWVLDGNSYTSRSGPRAVDGAERLQGAFAGREAHGMVRWRSDGG
jgi:iron complex transport system substrate-binding protein